MSTGPLKIPFDTQVVVSPDVAVCVPSCQTHLTVSPTAIVVDLGVNAKPPKDLKSIFAYLQSIPPIKNPVPGPVTPK